MAPQNNCPYSNCTVLIMSFWFAIKLFACFVTLTVGVMMQIHKLIEDVSTHACATRELLILLIVQVGVIITRTNCISSSPETPLRISIIKLNLNNRGCVVEGYSQPV